MDEIRIKGMGKINLALDVLRRREDGYHEVSMIMQTVNLYDELLLTRKTAPGIQIFCDTAELPCDEHNLIYKAARLIFEQQKIKEGVSVHLKKNIPIAAGMAGGSTDAAAALTGLNLLFDLGLTEKELEKLAVRIGADVPYCLHGGTYLSEGIGERLTHLCDVPPAYVVIAKPDISVSTKFVYEHLQLDKVKVHPDIIGMREAIGQQSLSGISSRLSNVLESVTVKEYPQIEKMKECLLSNGAMGALMSGSGPTVFGLFQERETAQKAFAQLQQTGFVRQGCVTEFAQRSCVTEETGGRENG